jgi:hypothetical protein
MQNAEKQLAAIGFGRSRNEPACWRAVRLDRPVSSAHAPETGPEPACSRALLHWRDILAHSPYAPAYRIARIDG